MNNIKKALVSIAFLLAFSMTCQPAFAIQKININTATAAELIELNGIGAKMAQRIIDYRKEHKFNKVEDILNIKGIGEKTYNKFKDQLTVVIKK